MADVQVDWVISMGRSASSPDAVHLLRATWQGWPSAELQNGLMSFLAGPF